jgi:NADP-dependent 3-hydroxy acid dehydrogenase YdfG
MTSTTLDTSTATGPLTGRTAVVTGASSGIGAATARLFAAQGARVALLARRADRIDALAAELTKDGHTAVAVPVDVADTGSIATAASRVADQLGPVDLLLNNAGVMLAAPLTESRTGDWQQMIDVNLTGVLRVADAFTPNLVAAAAEGRAADLLNISSVAASLTFPHLAVYSATKAAVTAYSKTARAELGPLGVRVSNIEPGLVTTELQGHVTDDAINEWVEDARSSLQWLSDGDLAELIAFTVSRPRHVNLSQVMVMPTQQV